ncbi:MAG TPA: ATP-binding protein [Chiayiivirga sp.]|nr:ATP-binding protein [Chiayiivirga sp.]
MTDFPRNLSPSLHTSLSDTPVVCVLGSRQCGKTTLARTLEPDFTYLSLDDPGALALAKSDPSSFIAALPQRAIIDEIQRAPDLLQPLKLAIDNDRKPGRFVLTGSANLLLLPTLGDSLAGRMEVLQLHPLTAGEQARAPGQFLTRFLMGKLQPKLASAAQPAAGAELPQRVVAGGFPEAVSRTEPRARAWHRAYLRTLLERDVQDVARIRDTSAVSHLLQLLALRNAKLLNVTSLSNELNTSRELTEKYLSICERLFLIRRLQPWHRNEAKRLIKTPKVHLLDSGLASTLAGVDTKDWMDRREVFGHFLESFVVQQLIAQAGWTDPDLHFWHYRDKDQVEVDLVISRGRAIWGVEVKASATVSPADGIGLRRLAAQCGKDWQGGILLHAGNSAFRLGDERSLAAPLAWLWEM